MNDRRPLNPVIAAIAKSLTIPGTAIGPGILVEIKDRLDTAATHQQIFDALNSISSNIEEISRRLETEESLKVDKTQLVGASSILSEWLYLESEILTKYRYLEVRGLAACEVGSPRELDQVYVEPRIRQRPDPSRVIDIQEWAQAGGSLQERKRLEKRLLEADRKDWSEITEGNGGASANLGNLLETVGSLVLIGPPGSGKSTSVKMLARRAAKAREQELEQKVEEGYARFPVILSLREYAEKVDDQSLLEHVDNYFFKLGGDALRSKWKGNYDNGRCLLLLDALDEGFGKGQEDRRTHVARKVDDLLAQKGDNVVLVTSRPIGYGLVRPNEIGGEYHLLPWQTEEIEGFVSKWFDAPAEETKNLEPGPAAAYQKRLDFLRELQESPSLTELAEVPLLLTLLLLLRPLGRELPKNKVDLYEWFIKTLAETWNRNRSLGNVTVVKPIAVSKLQKAWSFIACWLTRKRRETVTEAELKTKFEEFLKTGTRQNLGENESSAQQYQQHSLEVVGLFNEVGQGHYRFFHRSIQEYLAACRLCKQNNSLEEALSDLQVDSYWRETIRFTVSRWAIALDRFEEAKNFVESMSESADDPLEPITGRKFRLAFDLAVDIGMSLERLVPELVSRARLAEFPFVEKAYSSSLAGIRSSARLQGEAVEALSSILSEPNSALLVEALRLLAGLETSDWASDRHLDTLREILNEGGVRQSQYSAVILWRQGDRSEKVFRKATVEGFGSQRRYRAPYSPPQFFEGAAEVGYEWSVRDRIQLLEFLVFYQLEHEATQVAKQLRQSADLEDNELLEVLLLESRINPSRRVDLIGALANEKIQPQPFTRELIGKIKNWNIESDTVALIEDILKARDAYDFLAAFEWYYEKVGHEQAVNWLKSYSPQKAGKYKWVAKALLSAGEREYAASKYEAGFAKAKVAHAWPLMRDLERQLGSCRRDGEALNRAHLDILNYLRHARDPQVRIQAAWAYIDRGKVEVAKEMAVELLSADELTGEQRLNLGSLMREVGEAKSSNKIIMEVATDESDKEIGIAAIERVKNLLGEDEFMAFCRDLAKTTNSSAGFHANLYLLTSPEHRAVAAKRVLGSIPSGLRRDHDIGEIFALLIEAGFADELVMKTEALLRGDHIGEARIALEKMGEDRRLELGLVISDELEKAEPDKLRRLLKLAQDFTLTEGIDCSTLVRLASSRDLGVQHRAFELANSLLAEEEKRNLIQTLSKLALEGEASTGDSMLIPMARRWELYDLAESLLRNVLNRSEDPGEDWAIKSLVSIMRPQMSVEFLKECGCLPEGTGEFRDLEDALASPIVRSRVASFLSEDLGEGPSPWHREVLAWLVWEVES